MISPAGGPYEHRHLVSILAQAFNHWLGDNEASLRDILLRDREIEFEGTEESKHQCLEPTQIVFNIRYHQSDDEGAVNLETHSTRLKR